MFSRSRSTRCLPLLALGAILFLGPVGCASTKAREHWWQFWRPKLVASSLYKPDQVIIPPPPGVLNSDGTTKGSLGIGDNNIAGSPTAPRPLDEIMNAAEGRGPSVAGQVASELSTVYFGFDSYDLDGAAKQTLDRNLAWIKGHPGIEMQIEGHCDERGTIEYNLLLGERRAKSVKAYLVQQGISEKGLHTISYGKERPIDMTHSDVAFSKNRRAQFLVY